MKEILIVGLGGFLGAIARYKLGGFVLHHSDSEHFPLSTFVVNIIGCFLIGLVGGLLEKFHYLSPDFRLLLIVGILGGFTTFSSFGYETLFLIRRGDLYDATLNVSLSVIGGLVAVWVGVKLATVRL